MKYLSDYMKTHINDLLSRYGAFFAFGDKQYQAKAVPGIRYTSISQLGGLICPFDYCTKLYIEYKKILKLAINADINENGKDKIIARELSNYEAYVTGCIEDTYHSLLAYDITEEEIWEVYRRELPNKDV